MENDQPSGVVPIPQPPGQPATQPMLCPQCHQPVTPTEYFCPNCGRKLDDPPLSTSLGAQLWLYAFAIILPFLGYLLISYWKGFKYVSSKDPKVQQIGFIAIGLFAISSIYVLWQITALINGFVQAASNTAGLSSIL